MFQKLLAGITAAALCCTMPGLYWAASAEEQQPTVKTIQLDKSDRLSGTGRHKAHPGKPDHRQDQRFGAGQSGASQGDQVFLRKAVRLLRSGLSAGGRCGYHGIRAAAGLQRSAAGSVAVQEYIHDQALTCTYASVYNVTISEPATDDAVFEDKNVIIADPKSEASVVGNSTYYYNVIFPDGMDTPVSATSARSEVTDDGDWNVSREISLLYHPYALAT